MTEETAAADRKRFDVRPALLPTALLVTAELLERISSFESDSIPKPSEVLLDGVRATLDGTLALATLQTMTAALTGLLIGTVIGLALGIATGLFQPFGRLMTVTIEVFRPIPSIALIPVVMMTYGLGYNMEIALVAFATSWPVLLFSRAAIAGVHPRLKEVSRIMGFSAFDRIRKIILPAALPSIFVGFRLAVGIALVVSVTVEITANPIGLGNAMMLAEQSLRPAEMFAFIVWIGVIGWLANAALSHLQRRLFPAAMNWGAASA